MEGKATQLLLSETGVYYNTSDSEHVDLDGQVHALRERKGGRATEPICKIFLLLCQGDLSQPSRRYAPSPLAGPLLGGLVKNGAPRPNRTLSCVVKKREGKCKAQNKMSVPCPRICCQLGSFDGKGLPHEIR